MISGHISDGLVPIVEIGLLSSESLMYIPAIVDTGFSGYLALSERYVDYLDMSFKYVERYELADGSIIVKDVFHAHIVFGNEERDVYAIVTASTDTLIGTGLLRRHHVAIDYPQRIVQIR